MDEEASGCALPVSFTVVYRVSDTFGYIGLAEFFDFIGGDDGRHVEVQNAATDIVCPPWL
jgi:hypothetical protein